MCVCEIVFVIFSYPKEPPTPSEKFKVDLTVYPPRSADLICFTEIHTRENPPKKLPIFLKSSLFGGTKM